MTLCAVMARSWAASSGVGLGFAQVIVTNPDMLHVSIMPEHPLWARFISKLAYIVLDEAHVYKGNFGRPARPPLPRLSRPARPPSCPAVSSQRALSQDPSTGGSSSLYRQARQGKAFAAVVHRRAHACLASLAGACSHVGCVLRRLRRICAHYAASPRCCPPLDLDGRSHGMGMP
jgi:hypothetical protein